MILTFQARCCVIGPLDLFCGTVTSSPRVLTKFPSDFLPPSLAAGSAAGTKNGLRFKWGGNILWDRERKKGVQYTFLSISHVWTR